MQAEADLHYPLETGGIMLGWENGDIVVSNIIGPGPRAVHRRASFDPDTEWQDHQLAEKYEASGRTLVYLGDWHTHPGGAPTPSRRDRKTLATIAGYPAARCAAPIMVILGQGDDGLWTPASHRLVPRRSRLCPAYLSVETRLA